MNLADLKKPSGVAHFESHTAYRGGCWLWKGALDKDGYGKFTVHYKTKRAHRVAHEIYTGPIPPGALVLHRCDTPACVNPAHLFIGSPADNMRDKCAKGRHPCGEINKAAKLTEKQARKIFAASGTHVEVARSFGVTPQQISNIRNLRSWGHVNGPV